MNRIESLIIHPVYPVILSKIEFIVPVILIKTTGIPKYFGEIPKLELSHSEVGISRMDCGILWITWG